MVNKSSYSALLKSIDAAKANLLPGLVLQVLALALVLAYYFHSPLQARLDGLAQIKQSYGFVYSFLATAFFAGFIPFLYLKARDATRLSTPLSHGLFLVLFWGYKGMEVDFLYRMQGVLFGDEPDISVIVCKVLVDQFVYVPIVAAPSALVAYLWKDLSFDFRTLYRRKWIPFFRDSMPSALLSTWGVWVPTVAIIYCLPGPLQIPLFNIVICFWSLLFTTLTAGNGANEGRPKKTD